MTRTRSMLLAHHHADHRERCAVVAGRDVCRRCLVLYPLLLATLTATAAGVIAVPASWRNLVLWVLPLPAALEYSAEAFGRFRYSPRRQVMGTVLQAIGGGAGFAWELREPASITFWTAVIAYGCCALTVTAFGWRSQAKRRAQDVYQASLDAAERRLESMR